MLLSYENEAINNERLGKPIEHIIPPQTFKIENPVAVVSTGTHQEQANALKNYLFTPEGQKLVGRSRFPSGGSDGGGRLRQGLPDAGEAVDHC